MIELLVSLAIVALMATMAVPLMQISTQRAQEQELRNALREIRGAIDAYKRASDNGRIQRNALGSGYPANLQVLVDGVEDVRHPLRQKIYFLRQIPRDPFHPDTAVPAEQTWLKRAYANDPENFEPGEDVYDIRSAAKSVGLNGVPYRRW
ncbi:general secretion pathway protein GspG [beta proteobacterium AAP99]|nr:general secretion pathway protein GspG [beta proteobacterium AAP99]